MKNQIVKTDYEDKYLESLKETTEETKKHLEELTQHISKVYNEPRDKDEINLYQEVIDIIRHLKPESIPLFKQLMEKAEPNINDKKAIVQQYLITITLIEYLYYVKGKFNIKNFDISRLLLGIPYYSDNKVWLNQMSRFVLPEILKHNLL